MNVLVYICILAHLLVLMRAAEMNGGVWGRGEISHLSKINKERVRDFVVGGERVLQQKHLNTCSASRILSLPFIDPR